MDRSLLLIFILTIVPNIRPLSVYQTNSSMKIMLCSYTFITYLCTIFKKFYKMWHVVQFCRLLTQNAGDTLNNFLISCYAVSSVSLKFVAKRKQRDLIRSRLPYQHSSFVHTIVKCRWVLHHYSPAGANWKGMDLGETGTHTPVKQSSSKTWNLHSCETKLLDWQLTDVTFCLTPCARKSTKRDLCTTSQKNLWIALIFFSLFKTSCHNCLEISYSLQGVLKLHSAHSQGFKIL